MKKHLSKINLLLNRDAFWVTLFTFFGYWLVHVFFINLHFLEDKNLSKEDSDVNDIVYSKFGKVELINKINDEIILVNIGNANREEIAQMINIIGEKKPKVLGIDIVFNSEKEKFNLSLSNVLSKYKQKIVLGSYFTYDDDFNLNSLETSDSLLGKNIINGYTNFVTLYTQGTVRRYSPFTNFNGSEASSFTSQILKLYDSEKYKLLKKRNHSSEIINYKYAMDNFLTLDKDEVLDNRFQTHIKGKIVIFGFISEKNGVTLEDYHYTPLNQIKNKRDMAGIDIHANILNMVIKNDYINNFPKWLIYLFSFIFCFFHIKLFMILTNDEHIWFHFQSKFIQFISLMIIVFFSVLIYHFYNFRVETTIIAIPIALSVDIMHFGKAISKWLKLRFNVDSYFNKNSKH